MSLGTCESSSSCDDDEEKIEDDGQEGVAEGAHTRRDGARRRHCRRLSCSRSAARAAMRGYGVVLLELVGTRARQGDDVGQFKMADANDKGFGEAAPAEETVRRRAACVAGPAVHVRWCVDFGLGSGISECGNRGVCRGRSREKPEPEEYLTS